MSSYHGWTHAPKARGGTDPIPGGLAIYEIKVFDDQHTVQVGDARFDWEIPEDLDGAELIKVEAFVSTASSSGAVTVSIWNDTQAVDMLSTSITIDSGELNSADAATPPVVDAANAVVAHGDHLQINVDGAGTGAVGLGIVLVFSPSSLASVVLAGAKGDPGDPGADGAPGGIDNWTGAWDSGTAYATNDAVSNNGSSYVAIQSSTNIEPGVTSGWESYWMQLAQGALGGAETLNVVASSGASLTLDLGDGTAADVTLTAACTLSFTGAVASEADSLTLILRQDGTGGRTVTWPGSVTWLSGEEPVLKQGASAVDVVVLETVDGGTTWLGAQAGGPATVGADGWISDSSETWTYVSATSFKISGVDLTSKYPKGTRLKLTQTTVKYFVIAAVTFSTDTTVTITGGADFSLANAAISNNFHSYQDKPQGYPGWFNFTPATTGITGESSTAVFAVSGGMCLIDIALAGTSNATTKTFTLPIAVGKNGTFAAACYVRDNGTSPTTPGRLGLPNAGSATASLFKDMSSGAWTAAGSWFAIGAIHYPI